MFSEATQPPFKTLLSRQRRTTLARYAWFTLRVLCMVNILLLIMLVTRAFENSKSAVYCIFFALPLQVLGLMRQSQPLFKTSSSMRSNGLTQGFWTNQRPSFKALLLMPWTKLGATYTSVAIPPGHHVCRRYLHVSIGGVSYLLPDEANRLVDGTILAPGSNVYIGGLDVFHQLHCLVRLPASDEIRRN